jgi:hypothetical protein
MGQGFTDKEVEAELRRRRAGQRAGNESLETVDGRRSHANTTCGHCGIPIQDYTNSPFPLCDACDGD